MNDLLVGNLVRLAAYDPEEMGKAFSRWTRDSEYWRLMDTSPARMPSSNRVTKFIEKDMDELDASIYFFGVRRLEDDALIGEMILHVINWAGGDAFVGLTIGERENWGKGYGTEMMHLLLQYAFLEVNLHRVTLAVFEYNPRAIRSYEKAGFRHEGRMRRFLNKEGRRWDMLFMGILRDEWMGLDTAAVVE